jgi:hypothetical protein
MKKTMNHRLRLTDTMSRIVHACLLGLLFSPLAFADDGATSTLFCQPSLLRDQGRRFSAWSHSIAFANGKFVNAVAVKEFIDQPTDMGLAIFESDDGVHWHETAPFTCPLPRAVPGYCWRWDGEAFVYYITERNTGPDRKEYPTVVRQHRSVDLANWEFMGDEFTTRPDNRWYRCRWDELVILDDGENFYGYITSEPRPELARDSMGMLQSSDGVRWEVLPPPVFEWNGLPPQQMEVCLCEKIGDRYYLGMGSRSYMGHLGFSVVMFVSDSPTGPFRPDKGAFRLCGNTTRDTNWLAKTFRRDGEILLSNWITTDRDESFRGIYANGRSLWIGPLKKLIADEDGHARIAWWPRNEAAKTDTLPALARDAVFAHPAEKHRSTLYSFEPRGEDSITMKAGHDGAIAMLPEKLDFTRGVILEGVLRATEPRGPVIGTHWHPAAAGFFFEHSPGKGMLVQMETLGLTRTGIFDFRPEPAFDADEFSLAAFGNVQRGGPYLGLSRFVEEDVIGPLGYAVPCGIRSATPHRFRLLIKNGIWELYLDDRYVQTYITGPTSGRLGLFAKSGPVEFSDLKAWNMTPPEE